MQNKVTKETLNLITDIEICNTDYNDYPDFVDAFISRATWSDDGEELTEAELDELNENYRDFVHECVFNFIF